MSLASTEESLENGYGTLDDAQKTIANQPMFSKSHLAFLNSRLQQLEPQEILKWCTLTLPNMYQETAFGLSGLVIIDMLSHLSGPIQPNVELIFIDTLHHFSETLSLLQKMRQRYWKLKFHIYKPKGIETPEEFAEKYGEKLWESDEESYDFKAKVEPAQRAYRDLTVQAVLTGRRKTQGAGRAEIDVIEIDENGLVKVNPLANWTFEQVQDYVHEHNVPYNELLDLGYKSIGDWHSTQPVGEGEDERAGRWKGRTKTECGIHNPKSRYAQYLAELERKEKIEALNTAVESSLTIAE